MSYSDAVSYNPEVRKIICEGMTIEVKNIIENLENFPQTNLVKQALILADKLEAKIHFIKEEQHD